MLISFFNFSDPFLTHFFFYHNKTTFKPLEKSERRGEVEHSVCIHYVSNHSKVQLQIQMYINNLLRPVVFNISTSLVLDRLGIGGELENERVIEISNFSTTR